MGRRKMEGSKVSTSSSQSHNVFNALAGSGNSTFFNTVTGNISDKYELDTTPAGWTFSIWGIIYFAIAATLVFYAVTIFMRNQNGYIYLNPVVASPMYCIVYSINFLMNLVRPSFHEF